MDYIRVIQHEAPLFLLGSDLLRLNRGKDNWGCVGIHNAEDRAGRVAGYLVFRRAEHGTQVARLLSTPNNVQPFRVPGIAINPEGNWQ